MKKVFYLLVFLFSIVTYSQSGFYEGFTLLGGSNFKGKTNGAMHQYGAEIEIGYQFNKFIKIGLFYPIVHTIFRENNERFSFVGSGGGIRVNTNLYSKNDFSIRLDLATSLMDSRREQTGLGKNQKWFFVKSSAGLQFHANFDGLESLFIGCGVYHYTDSHQYSDTFSKQYHFFSPYLSIGFITSFLDNKKKEK